MYPHTHALTRSDTQDSDNDEDETTATDDARGRERVTRRSRLLKLRLFPSLLTITPLDPDPRPLVSLLSLRFLTLALPGSLDACKGDQEVGRETLAKPVSAAAAAAANEEEDLPQRVRETSGQHTKRGENEERVKQLLRDPSLFCLSFSLSRTACRCVLCPGFTGGDALSRESERANTSP